MSGCWVVVRDKMQDGYRYLREKAPGRVSYGGLMREYARQRGLRRLMVPGPGSSKSIMAAWAR